MPIVRQFAAAAVLASLAFSAQATAIYEWDSTPNEHLINFDGPLPANLDPANLGSSFTLQGVKFTAGTSWAWQYPSAGNLLGTQGNAINEASTSNDPQTHAIALEFDKPIVRFAATFGNCQGCYQGGLYALVLGTNASLDVVDSQEFPAFSQTFVGFDFDSPVTAISFLRGDNETANTFLDDIYFVYADEPASGDVPEPGSLALLGLGALGAALARRRRG